MFSEMLSLLLRVFPAKQRAPGNSHCPFHHCSGPVLSMEGASTGVNKQCLPHAFSCVYASDLVDYSYSPCVWAQIHFGGPPLRFASMHQPSSRNWSESAVRVKCGDVWAGENRTPSHLLVSACLWAPAPHTFLEHVAPLPNPWTSVTVEPDRLRICNHFKETVLKDNTVAALCWIFKASVVYMEHVSLRVLRLQKIRILSSV